jgi:hypothetical protein
MRTTITHRDLRLSYIVNPVTNMNITIGASMRDYDNVKALNRTSYYYIAFRTSLNNLYYDF